MAATSTGLMVDRRAVVGMLLGLALGGTAAATLATSAGAQQKDPSPGAPREKTGADGASPDDPGSLRERAAAFWAARVSRDYRKQWELMEPRVRGRLSADDYAAGRGQIRYVAYQVEDAVVNGAFATVKVRVIAQPRLDATGARRIQLRAVLLDDPWIMVDGVWYRREAGDDQTPAQGTER